MNYGQIRAAGMLREKDLVGPGDGHIWYEGGSLRRFTDNGMVCQDKARILRHYLEIRHNDYVAQRLVFH